LQKKGPKHTELGNVVQCLLVAVKSTMNNAFPLNSHVQFTQERLAVLTPRDRQGLTGRIGVVQTDGNKIEKPTVYFPATAAFPELRLFRVDPRHLEVVESSTSRDKEPQLDGNANHGNSSDPVDATEAATSSGDERLSQSDMDNLFG
jgi:hypothetical protein